MQRLQKRIDGSIEFVRKSLDATRNPRPLKDVPHSYRNKFEVAELAARCAIRSQLTVLAAIIGLTPSKLSQLQQIRGKRTVSLRLSSSTSCDFVKTCTRDEEAATRLEVNGAFGKTSYTTVTTITEHFWKYTVNWEISVFLGTDVGDREVLRTRRGSHPILTRGEEAIRPVPERQSRDPITVDITWLLNECNHGLVDFSIDRKQACTPRRNSEVDSLLSASRTLSHWCNAVKNAMKKDYTKGYSFLLPKNTSKPNFKAAQAFAFNPVPAMLTLEECESRSIAARGSQGSPFSELDFEAILQLQRDNFGEQLSKIQSLLPMEGVFTTAEANLVFGLAYSVALWTTFSDAVQAIEELLMQQLVAAIGKEIQPYDFAKYMKYHNRQLYRGEFSPRGFCYSVRRPGHFPEGVISLEDSNSNQPLDTTCLHRPDGHPMKFLLGAGVEVEFHGEHFVHSLVRHEFSTILKSQLHLIARAKQFSSFILMLGVLGGPDSFQPTHAILVQNKDEFHIPLVLETIPAPQEFRDAVESLSPEQKDFCTAYRQMQLAGTLFAVAVIQVKPQLENLLNLPDGALTKEVQLCQDLMNLFIEYQIPSDLLAFDGDKSISRFCTHVNRTLHCTWFRCDIFSS